LTNIRNNLKFPIRVVVGKGKLFYFFFCWLKRWQKINVLDRAVDFFQLAGNG
jgi:hypothetical protein